MPRRQDLNGWLHGSARVQAMTSLHLNALFIIKKIRREYI